MDTSLIDPTRAERFVSSKWDDEIVPQLVEYIRIPNKSPMFDADWVEHGYMEDAVRLMEGWARAQDIPGMQLDRRCGSGSGQHPVCHGGSAAH